VADHEQASFQIPVKHHIRVDLLNRVLTWLVFSITVWRLLTKVFGRMVHRMVCVA
jgi:hypothetical protein